MIDGVSSYTRIILQFKTLQSLVRRVRSVLAAIARIEHFIETQTLVDLRETCRMEDTFEEPIETKATQQVSNQVENTSEEETDAADDLGERLCQGDID